MINEKKELPYLPIWIFKLRIPGIHYKMEKVEFIQGLIVGATALSAIPYMTEYLGLPYELAWSCIILEAFLYILHANLGDPVIPGWITATLPLTLAYLTTYEQGPKRIQAMIALQLLVGLVFIFMGITKLAESFIRNIPTSIKGGILLATPITVLQGQLSENGQLKNYPIAVGVGALFLAIISFSSKYQEARKKYKVLDIIAQYGNLFPYLIAMIIGIIVGELALPSVEFGTFIKVPQFKEMFDTVSVFGVGFPGFKMFLNALPLALICYVIAFGDFVTSESLINEAKEARDDEIIDFNSSRSNLISGIRNVILSIFAPFPPLAGPLWVGMTVSVSIRYKEGKKAMKSLIGAMGSFRLGTFISVICIPVVTLLKPVFPVGAGITLIFQAFVCARIGMEYCESDLDKSIAAIMAVVLAMQGSAWALLVGFGLNLLLSNWSIPGLNKERE
ncbi:hypothetical protein C8E03_10678 [Lachnotalea glycerini]|uniref:Uncharacterized protein n=1 Tax=Lachnotalea glycerini TaxID=1763509 RepID=A0A255IMG2_9FIRM|nr:hypothetical protein [Lachnotalea glycerini]PXV89429.1 hypothetical protein C8E03_10678 [Lachnotalea glycerini]RDY32382.1 hypothetical protein CG710_005225 [Lachnotalea glycerini]